MGPTTMGNPFLLVFISSAGEPGEARATAAGEREDQRPARACGAGSQEAGGRGQGGRLPVDEPARHRDRRHADGAGTRLRPGHAQRRGDAAHPRQRDLPDGAVVQPGRRRSWCTDWYQKTLGGEYEGTDLPWLYHKYAGHDNNRDAFQTNLVESQYMAKILFRDWMPQAYVDHHHMGSYGARIYLPPYAEPVRPHGRSADLARDELVRRAHGLQGRGGGQVGRAQHGAVFRLGALRLSLDHAVPQHRRHADRVGQREAGHADLHPPRPAARRTRGTCRPTRTQTTFPNPWPGGWWRLRDIVERQKISAWALLDLAARNRETVLWNAYLKAKRQTERGAEGKPAALRDPRLAARSADRGEAGEQAAGSRASRSSRRRAGSPPRAG